MMNVLKKYLWMPLLILLIPCVINFIMVKPIIWEITGNGTSWLSFWGSYIGSLVSSAIALFILWKQLNQNHQENEESRTLSHQENEDNRKQNHKENEENRKLQLKNIEYQQKTQWLNLLRSKLADYYSAFCFNDLTFLEVKILEKENLSEIRNEIKMLYDRMTNVDFSVRILFPGNADSDEERLLLEIKKVTEEFYAVLSDLDWYILTVAYLPGSFESNKESYIKKTDYFAEAAKYNLSHDRIWDIIRAYSYNIYDMHMDIVSKYLDNVFDVLNPDSVQEHITNLIDYEQNKILTYFHSAQTPSGAF